MDQSKIVLKPIFDLRVDGENRQQRYFVPAYQRGYRWSITQVTQLLDDVREFTKRDRLASKEFYCLQPLVLRAREDGSFEVVDGQQRLTTILLVLKHFNARLAANYQQMTFRIDYETRSDLETFLDNPTEEAASSNIDYFHIDQATKTIRQWFAARDNEVEAFKDAFLNRVKIIWYELPADENAVAAFTRLNVGKIPLTNGELIRALFLKRNGTVNSIDQQHIALEWDDMEKALQDNSFWSFLSNETGQRDGRIGFLFDHVAREGGMKAGADEYGTFNFFSERLSTVNSSIAGEWLAVKRFFMALEEWYQDRSLYHMVGFLIWSGEDVNAIRALSAGTTKREFRDKLLRRILESVFRANLTHPPTSDWLGEQLDGIEYSAGSHRVRSVLLLFNVATLLLNSQSNIRFQFSSFKREKWDIEHVRSVAADRPGSRVLQVEWSRRCLGYLQGVGQAPELQNELETFITLAPKDITDARFDPVYEAALKFFKEEDNDEGDNRLFNLALLDSETNRSYKNAVFAVKRNRILALDRDGIFVPLCTRNVFLKCYSPNVDHVIFWNEQDQAGYRDAMISTLYAFFTGRWSE